MVHGYDKNCIKNLWMCCSGRWEPSTSVVLGVRYYHGRSIVLWLIALLFPQCVASVSLAFSSVRAWRDVEVIMCGCVFMVQADDNTGVKLTCSIQLIFCLSYNVIAIAHVRVFLRGGAVILWAIGTTSGEGGSSTYNFPYFILAAICCYQFFPFVISISWFLCYLAWRHTVFSGCSCSISTTSRARVHSNFAAR